MKRLLLATLLSLTAVCATASDSKWSYLATNEGGSIAFMPSSYAEDALGYRTIWVRLEHKKPSDGVYKDEMLLIADCDARKLGPVHTISYNKHGNVVAEDRVPEYSAQMRTVPPSGFQYVILEGLCAVP